ncbi:MAG TPA: hypothetical protein VNO43_03220 [Candidatus Eisenbacteria bacterium]|nr:hypothetical protein [Candidatus Eisenbacteria bacterium]
MLGFAQRVGPEGIIITKHKKPLAELVPVHSDNVNLIGSFKGKIEGNILTTGVKRDAES